MILNKLESTLAVPLIVFKYSSKITNQKFFFFASQNITTDAIFWYAKYFQEVFRYVKIVLETWQARYF